MTRLIVEVDRLRETTSGGPHSHLGSTPKRFWNLGRRFNGIKLVGTLRAGEMHFARGRDADDRGTDNRPTTADALW